MKRVFLPTSSTRLEQWPRKNGLHCVRVHLNAPRSCAQSIACAVSMEHLPAMDRQWLQCCLHEYALGMTQGCEDHDSLASWWLHESILWIASSDKYRLTPQPLGIAYQRRNTLDLKFSFVAAFGTTALQSAQKMKGRYNFSTTMCTSNPLPLAQRPPYPFTQHHPHPFIQPSRNSFASLYSAFTFAKAKFA
eukprot:6463903-Amphidinium_carterae.1